MGSLCLWLLLLDAHLHQVLAAEEIRIPAEIYPFVLIGIAVIWGIKALAHVSASARARRQRFAEQKAWVEMQRKIEEGKRVELNMSVWQPERVAEILKPQIETKDDVNITVFAPSEAQPADDICIQILLHTQLRTQQAEEQALQMDPEAQKLASIPLVVPLKLFDKVKITLDSAEAEIVERTQTLEWHGSVAHSLFFVKLPSAAKLPPIPTEGVALNLKAFIYVNGLPVGFIKFKILIKSKTTPQIPLPLNELARRYRRAFLSYASEDRVHVLRSAQFLAAMNIEFFQDLLTLAPGQRWEQHLYEQIDACDLFLLFWSHFAAESEWVIKETEYALRRAAASRDRPELHPIILEGPPPVTPPPSLAEIHFNDPVRYIIFAEEMLPSNHASRN
jgi:hypothetical protein